MVSFVHLFDGNVTVWVCKAYFCSRYKHLRVFPGSIGFILTLWGINGCEAHKVFIVFLVALGKLLHQLAFFGNVARRL